MAKKIRMEYVYLSLTQWHLILCRTHLSCTSLFLLQWILRCNFTFLHFIWSSFCALSWCFYLSHSLSFLALPPSPSSNIWSGEKAVWLQTHTPYSLFFFSLSQLWGTLGPSFLEESFLSLCVSFSLFSFGSGSIWCDRRLFCPCLHIILLQNESENLCLLCMKTILLEPFSSQVQCVLRLS